MKIVVIEDEQLTADDLIDILQHCDATIEVVAHLSSVQEGVDYLSQKPEIDLILSDIQLGDGLSFDIFKLVDMTVPVIFCTAYDEYAIDAFKANGIDYVLKPYSQKSIQQALARYHSLKANFENKLVQVEQVIDQLLDNQVADNHKTVLVHHRDKIIPIKISDISLAYIRNEWVYLRTFDGQNYSINKSLDELMQLLGESFYRANRQFIVNRESVQDVTTFLTRKYSVNLKFEFKEQIIVSKEKMTSFIRWLKNEG